MSGRHTPEAKAKELASRAKLGPRFPRSPGGARAKPTADRPALEKRPHRNRPGLDNQEPN